MEICFNCCCCCCLRDDVVGDEEMFLFLVVVFVTFKSPVERGIGCMVIVVPKLLLADVDDVSVGWTTISVGGVLIMTYLFPRESTPICLFLEIFPSEVRF